MLWEYSLDRVPMGGLVGGLHAKLWKYLAIITNSLVKLENYESIICNTYIGSAI